MAVIDATNAVFGRLAATTAERLQNGETITIVNVEKSILTGNPKSIKEIWLDKYTKGHPHHGPKWPKTPDRMLNRSIRGMMPYRRKSGRAQMKKLKIFIGTNNIDVSKAETMKRDIRSKFITLGDLARVLGGWQV